MRLGEVIALYLQEHDMSLRAFARLSGITATNLSYIVNGKTPRGNAQAPTITTYSKIAKAMGLTTDELVSMVDDEIAWGSRSTYSDDETKLINLYRSLNDEGKAKILDNIMDLVQLKRYTEDTDFAASS